MRARLRVFHCNQDAKVIAYHRWDQQGPGDSVVVVVNLRDRNVDDYTIGFPRPGKTRFNSDSYSYGRNFANHATPDVGAWLEERDGLPCSGSVGIGPYTVAVFSQDE